MTDKPDLPDVDEAAMKEFCAAIGELILWASLIDAQLNKALVGMFALPEHAMIEPIVAQLDARPKAELLKKRAKTIPSKDWKNGITNWVERAEKANANRNTVAHHAIRIEGGTITLHTSQLGKILSNLKDNDGKLEAGDRKGLSDIQAWIDQARNTYIEGQNVIANLDRFREAAAKAI
ncbi:hypothetical protein HT136_25890 [Novosphingobium profundi]|uniref:hypothetical protein n=1 Tax=Novosphingobium profundi TaxID=1774954 RepID=UPI001BDA5A29|nr:hypothetical protein [Novosphingobium profundi]MBT0671803.1 hypothetical protein [Novosphingobium profundi]